MKFRSFLLALLLCILCVSPAYALEYDFDGAEDYPFGSHTPDDSVSEYEELNVDWSKSTALIPPGFGSPTSYLPDSGEALTPNLVPGALSGGLVAQVGSVSYVNIPICVSHALPATEEICSLHTILNISKTDVSLVGFMTPEQRECYLMLTSVSGAGTKAGLEILGALDVLGVHQAIASESVEMLTQVKGIGKKLAQRIILECRYKVAEEAFPIGAAATIETASTATLSAVEALVSLGYKQKEALAAVADIDASLPLEAIISQALRKF